MCEALLLIALCRLSLAGCDKYRLTCHDLIARIVDPQRLLLVEIHPIGS
jgi:hypothetical protein